MAARKTGDPSGLMVFAPSFIIVAVDREVQRTPPGLLVLSRCAAQQVIRADSLSSDRCACHNHPPSTTVGLARVGIHSQ